MPILLISEEVNNSLYLENLDAEISELIELLTTFNSIANNLPDKIAGVNVYKNFLMDITLECSNIRKQIAESEDGSANERELIIKNIIKSIKANVNFVPVPISDEQAKKNFIYLEIYYNRFEHIIISILKSLLDEERKIVESNSITKIYLDLHTRHFLLSLINSFVKNSKDISNKNQFLLLKIAQEIDSELHSKKGH